MPPLKRFLINPIKIRIDDNNLDFNTAKDIADKRVQQLTSNLMLLSWYKGKTGLYFPDVDCHGKNKPAWLIYAESRGGDITIDINNEEYVFIYKSWA